MVYKNWKPCEPQYLPHSIYKKKERRIHQLFYHILQFGYFQYQL